MASKPNFAAGLKTLQAKPESRSSEQPELIPDLEPKKKEPARRDGKVSIAGYFEPEVRMQIAIMAARQRKTQVELMAEAYNLLFEKYGEPQIAKA